MSPLLTLLTALETARPDEIVAKLSNKGWRRPSELGQEYFDQHKDSTPHVWCYTSNRGEVGSLGGRDPGYPWHFLDAAGNNYPAFVERLENNHHTYWIIPYNEYNQGDLPPCITS